MILVNSLPVGFSYKLKDADHVSVYPVFESIDISSVTHLRKNPLRDLKFVLDVHLGKLTKYLRLCGFDTYYDKNLKDHEIIDLAISEKRVILTRDLELLKNKKVTRGYWIRSPYPREQLKDVLFRFDLMKQVNLFTRCMECNAILKDVAKEEVLDRLMPKTRRYFRKFKKCHDCGRIYWNGSHYQSMKRNIKILKSETRKAYISAIKEADKGNIKPLVEFARS